jgi:hypothetical protein
MAQYDLLDSLSKGSSDTYLVKKTDKGLIITAPGEELQQLQRFQSIAHEIIEREGEGYRLAGNPKTTSRFSGDLCVAIEIEYLQPLRIPER